MLLIHSTQFRCRMCRATSKKDNKLFVYVFILGIYIKVVGFNALSMRACGIIRLWQRFNCHNSLSRCGRAEHNTDPNSNMLVLLFTQLKWTPRHKSGIRNKKGNLIWNLLETSTLELQSIAKIALQLVHHIVYCKWNRSLNRWLLDKTHQAHHIGKAKALTHRFYTFCDSLYRLFGVRCSFAQLSKTLKLGRNKLCGAKKRCQQTLAPKLLFKITNHTIFI